MTTENKEYGLYYQYGGNLADSKEPERLIHRGPEVECERVMRARLIEKTGVATTAYVVKPLRETKKVNKPFKRKR